MRPTKAQLEARAEWVAALRSGDYNQTTGTLCRADDLDDGGEVGYCCLGVATIPLWEAHPDRKVTSGGHIGYREDVYIETVTLPWDAQKRLGLTTNPWVVVDGQLTTLTGLNDSGFWSFAQIADVIEAQGDDWSGNGREAVPGALTTPRPKVR